jgi:Ser/Thr protein kinase RdoA (MazF antagonist)
LNIRSTTIDHLGREVATTSEPGDLPPRLLRRWGLPEPPGARVEPLGGGPAGRSWRVTAGPAAFLLKEFAGVRRRQVLFRHRVTAALADRGLPVPAAIPTTIPRTGAPGDGRTLVTAAGHRYALYPWVDGRRRGGLDLSLTQCQELGELLGRVHAALDALTPPVQQTLLVPTARAARAVADIDRLLAGAARDAPAGRAVSVLRERRALLVELGDHQPPDLDTATVGYVHGDFHAGSLVYGLTRRVSAIVGWGRLAVGPYAGELVLAAVRLFARPGEHGLDLERVESFVRGHAAAFPLDGGQVQAAAHRVWWERLCDLGGLARGGTAGDAPPGGDPLVDWWTGNLDRSLDAFAAPYAAPPDAAAAGPSAAVAYAS